jgi:predicted ester cyclase
LDRAVGDANEALVRRWIRCRSDHDVDGLADLVSAGHHGAFLDIAPTGILATFRGACHCRIEDQKIAEDWDVFDLLTQLMTLGGRVTA